MAIYEKPRATVCLSRGGLTTVFQPGSRSGAENSARSSAYVSIKISNFANLVNGRKWISHHGQTGGKSEPDRLVCVVAILSFAECRRDSKARTIWLKFDLGQCLLQLNIGQYAGASYFVLYPIKVGQNWSGQPRRRIFRLHGFSLLSDCCSFSVINSRED